VITQETAPFEEFFAIPLRNGLTKPKRVRGSGTKMVNMGELFAHDRIRAVEMDRVPMSERERELALLEEDDLLFARQSLVREGAGKCSIFLEDTEEVTFESHIIRARLDRAKAEPLFFFYYFRSPEGRLLMDTIIEQVAAAGVRGSDLAMLPVPDLPLGKQLRIAHILGPLDDKIELNRRMNRTLEAIARAMFKSWFIDFDPVHAKAEGREPVGMDPETAALFPDSFQDSPLGKIPKGWEVGTLADFSSLNPEAWSKETRPAVINYVDLSNTKWGRIEKVTAYAQQGAPSRAQRILRPRDTIVGTVRPSNGSYAFISEDGLTGSTGFAVLRPLNVEYAEFVYLAATAAENVEALSRLADGGAYPAVRPEVVVATQVVTSGDDVIKGFSRVSGPLLAETAENARESRILAALRDALLPELISGLPRVGDLDRFREEEM